MWQRELSPRGRRDVMGEREMPWYVGHAAREGAGRVRPGAESCREIPGQGAAGRE